MASHILVVTDLHLDQWLEAGRDPFASLDPDRLASLDALIVAGDLADKPKVRWPVMLAHLSRYVDPVHIHLLPGNHDYYHHTIDGDDRLARICGEAGMTFAQRRVISIGDIRILCSTLWTDFALDGDPAAGMAEAACMMNDYRYIRRGDAGYRRLRPTDVVRVHQDHRDWLERTLAEPFGGRTMVVTHHAPLGACLPSNYPAPAAYASDLGGLIDRYRPDHWFFGHTHVPAEVMRGATRIRNVSLGYPQEVPRGQEAAAVMRGYMSLSAGTGQ